MAVTRLKRKEKKNHARATNKVEAIKRLKFTPPMKEVDVAAIKAQFRGEKPDQAPTEA